ncbi:MAG: hypothetical protein Q8P26_01750 [Candidatus Levybacteria bacterium]|nr:hypothetical protein [Candidatus Levybacteria bacterium]
MTRIVLTAENFAFGPIGKLLVVADLLKKKGHTLIFVGFGTSLQLAKKFPFDEIHEVDTDLESSKEILQQLINRADLLISSMDLSSIKIANDLSIPAVWIDCLFWFWENIPQETYGVKAYIRELTISDTSNENKFKHKIQNFYTVGPIIGQTKLLPKKSQALISFGGGEASYWYKVGKDTNYPFLMTYILKKYVDWKSFDKVILASSEHIVYQLKEKFPDSLFKFTTLSQNDFIKELTQSKILLTTAGLVTTEFTFQQKIPVIFLPSSNNSHYLLLEELRNLELAPASVQLSDFLKTITIRGVSPKESMQAVMGQLRMFENSEKIQKMVGEKINLFIKNMDNWAKRQATNGKKYIDSLGKNGANSVVEIIENIINHK